MLLYNVVLYLVISGAVVVAKFLLLKEKLSITRPEHENTFYKFKIPGILSS
jgi:hypothetical protein